MLNQTNLYDLVWNVYKNYDSRYTLPNFFQ